MQSVYGLYVLPLTIYVFSMAIIKRVFVQQTKVTITRMHIAISYITINFEYKLFIMNCNYFIAYGCYIL